MKRQFFFRIEEELIKKLEYVAQENERNTTQEITLLIKKHILKYEFENGEIRLKE